MEARDTCLYIHTRADDGLIFYVGIGLDYRPASLAGRNKWWGAVVARHGYEAHILLADLTWSEACAVEKVMIAEFRSEVGQQFAKLTNLTDGGDGVKGYKLTEEGQKAHAEAMKKLAASPEWQRKNAEVGKRNSANPGWQRKNAEAMRKLSTSSEWQEKMRQVHADPEWQESIRRRSASPEWQRKNAEGHINIGLGPGRWIHTLTGAVLSYTGGAGPEDFTP